MNSRLYIGHIEHERVRPVRNRFRYPVYYVYLDLAEIDGLDASMRRFSHNRPNIVSFWDRDHGPRDGTALRPWIDALIARAGVDLEGGSVRLLTFPRVLGTRFYPVSFWYCFHADGTARAILAEVHNTVRDRHGYLLHEHGAPIPWDGQHRLTATKAFWVSPFVPVENATYDFKFSEPASGLSIALLDSVDNRLVLTTRVELAAEPLTDATLTRCILRHGPVSAVAIALILWQAAKLLAKRVPFIPHTPPPAEELSL